MDKPDSAELLKSLDVLLEDLSPEQLGKIDELSKTIPDPSKMTVQQAMSLVNTLGLDIEKLQKNARRKRAELLEALRKPRIGANEVCPCKSGKKYKKCCRLKQVQPPQTSS